MPTGHAIPNMMDNEVVEFFYTCLKNVQGPIDFEEVARILGLKNANSARARMKAMIKAQQKTRSRPGTAGGGRAKADSVRATGRPAKRQKRKVSVDDEDGEEPDEEDAEHVDVKVSDKAGSGSCVEAGEGADEV